MIFLGEPERKSGANYTDLYQWIKNYWGSSRYSVYVEVLNRAGSTRKIKSIINSAGVHQPSDMKSLIQVLDNV